MEKKKKKVYHLVNLFSQAVRSSPENFHTKQKVADTKFFPPAHLHTWHHKQGLLVSQPPHSRLKQKAHLHLLLHSRYQLLYISFLVLSSSFARATVICTYIQDMLFQTSISKNELSIKIWLLVVTIQMNLHLQPHSN